MLRFAAQFPAGDAGDLVSYFYTVRPIHQKEVLDEEIAQKRLEVRDKERQLQALAADIQNKSRELAEKERLLLGARSDANAARSEARDTYDALRIQYVGVISGDFARCANVAVTSDLDGSELKKCPESVIHQGEYMFEKLKQKDKQLLIRLIRKAAKEAQPSLDALVLKQRQTSEKVRQELADAQRELDDAKANQESGDSAARLKSIAAQYGIISRMSSLRAQERNLRVNAYQEFYKILERSADKIRDQFLELT